MMRNRRMILVALLALLAASALSAHGEGCGGFLDGYCFYQGSWPAGPHYQHIQLIYGDLNPMNEPKENATSYWPYPSPFVLFPDGVQLDPLKQPLTTLGDNYAMGSTDAKLYQQWACYPGNKALYTFWYFLRVGPPPAEGEVLPPHTYFMRPYPFEDEGNYYIIYNEVFEGCCEAARSPRTIGFWKNWDNRYSTALLDNLITLGLRSSSVFNGVTADTLKSTIQSSKTMEQRARAQMLALWLNILSGKLGLGLYVDVSTVPNWNTILTGSADGKLTVNSVVYQIEQKMVAGGLTTADWEAIKSIADAINNEMVLVSTTP